MDTERIYFEGVPYGKALRAFAYSGMPFDKAICILTGCDYLRPLDVKQFELDFEDLRAEALEIDDKFQFSQHILPDLDISPLYEWVVAMGNQKKSFTVKIASKLFDGMRHPYLRRTVDILLFVDRNAEDIAEALENKSDSPWLRWDADIIKMYEKFFWDVKSMTIDDWYEYGSWWVKREQYPCRYVFMFPTGSVNDLLWEAGIIPDISSDAMGEIMLHECFLRFKDNIKFGKEMEAMRYMDSFRKLMDTMKKGIRQESATRKRKERELDGIIDRMNIVFSPGEVKGDLHVSDLEENFVVSDRENVSLNKVLEDEQ